MRKIIETKDSYLKKMKAKFDDLNYKWSLERNKLEAKAQHAKAEAVEVSFSEAKDKQGRIIGKMAFFVDISKRKQMEKKLR